MRRMALIISNPGETGAENYCSGVLRDVVHYSKFLKSPFGGRWREDELIPLPRPSENEVRRAISLLRGVDYAFIVFSGHGYYDYEGQDTKLELRRGEEIESEALSAGASKQTTILDCCRKVHFRKAMLEGIEEKIAAELPRVDPGRCRLVFDAAVEQCSNGKIILHGCDIDETAGDDSRTGGVYSWNLISGALRWTLGVGLGPNKRFDMLSVVLAHNTADAAVQAESGGTQSPQIRKPRSGPYFPFCVMA